MVLEQSIVLPLSVITVIDLSRVGREISNLDDFLLQSTIRTPGTPMSLPRLSKLLDDTAQVNKLNLLEQDDRTALINALSYIKEHGPRMHISFSAEPSATFVTRVAEYIRNNISPLVLLQVGLQPTIAAGCIIRTPSKQFDLSLRRHLHDNTKILTELIHAVQDTPQPAVRQVVVA